MGEMHKMNVDSFSTFEFRTKMDAFGIWEVRRTILQAVGQVGKA